MVGRRSAGRRAERSEYARTPCTAVVSGALLATPVRAAELKIDELFVARTIPTALFLLTMPFYLRNS